MSDPIPEREIAEDLSLRSKRPVVVRLSPKVLVGLGSVSAVAILGAVAYAMTSHRSEQASPELYNVGSNPPEQVRALPGDYRTPPKLGPPLPGDLGGPILAAGAPAPAIGVGGSPPDPTAQDPAAQAGRQRLDQEREAARTSRLFASDAQATADLARLPVVLGDDLAQPAAGGASGALAGGGLLDGSVDRRTTSADRLSPPASPYVVQAGAVIPAALVTGIRSDLPGQIIGQVTQQVYDSPTGRRLLIPQGSKLIGVYDSRTLFGQSRLLVAWTRLILPDGRSLVLEKLPAGDVEGYAGLADRVDRHWGGLFGMAGLSTLLGIGAGLGQDDDESDLIQALRTGAGRTLNQVGQQAVGRGLSVAPTLSIRPGSPVRVMVTRDLVLEPYEG